MSKKILKQLADLIIELNCEYPFSGEIVDLVEKRLRVIAKENPKFDKLKWDRYISAQISKLITRKKLSKET